MLVVGLIDIQNMQSVIKGVFFFFFSEGVGHNIEEKSLSSVSELTQNCVPDSTQVLPKMLDKPGFGSVQPGEYSEGVGHNIEEKSLSSVSELTQNCVPDSTQVLPKMLDKPGFGSVQPGEYQVKVSGCL